MKQGEVLNEVLRRAKDKGIALVDTAYLHDCYNEAMSYISYLLARSRAFGEAKFIAVSQTPVDLPDDFVFEHDGWIGNKSVKVFRIQALLSNLVYYKGPWVRIFNAQVQGSGDGQLFYYAVRDFYSGDDDDVDLPDAYIPMFVDLVTGLYLLRLGVTDISAAMFFIERGLASVAGGENE